ncbi:DUF4870 domain-containing protein [Polaribacter batillariae]|uniref:DUF4870 domain-containing protein n=1 Tax=Polaribacter batillariae TaxID=2808900 RepID=UPI001FB164C5|nr:DUF4870 domain-containing protein [Polaribacter batillariae]
METQTIAKKLKYQRKLKGYSQIELSEKSNVTIRTIQRIEKGDVTPHLQTLKLLAEALNIGVEDISVLNNPKEESIQKKWLLFIHGSPILGFIFPFTVLFPLFLWIHKREDNSIYNIHAIKVINFQLSIALIHILSFILLLTVQGWGFLFFILIIPINFLLIIYNIFKSITTQKCFYPLSIPFLNIKKNSTTTILKSFLILLITISCTTNKKNKLQKLTEYEGLYEYKEQTTLNIVASGLDTTLYAILDDAKYPLKHIKKDSFLNIRKIPVVFKRDKNKSVIGYESESEYFKLLSTKIKKPEMFPRKELFKKPEKYKYNIPSDNNDGLKVGNLLDEFSNPELIIEMVKETIKGNFPEVHSILIYKNDKLVLEEYFYGYDKNTQHQLRSASKPFIGTLLGIAIDKGFIKDEKQKLLPYFFDTYKNIKNIDAKKKRKLP